MFNNINNFFKETPNSVLFWNGLILSILITIGVIDLMWLIITLFFGSLLVIVLVIENFGGNVNIKNHLWINFMPITWIMFLMVTIIETVITLYRKIITPFNNWLNKSKQ